jgi:glyoxylase-like metal-dependent hydrolase (beta-lactamase superfamily II)
MNPAPGLVTGMMFQMFVRPVERVEPATVEHHVHTQEVLPVAGGLTTIHVPGHCAGQLAFLWPRHGGVLSLHSGSLRSEFVTFYLPL